MHMYTKAEGDVEELKQNASCQHCRQLYKKSLLFTKLILGKWQIILSLDFGFSYVPSPIARSPKQLTCA